MEKVFRRFFVPGDSERTVKKIFWWWELRRITFNAVLLVLGVISIVSFFVFVNDPVSFLTPPFFAMMGILMYAVMANLLYTLGWIVEIFFLKIIKSETKKLATIMLIVGFSFSLLLTLAPGCYVLIANLSGDPLTSPYYSFTREQPLQKDIVGVYEMDSIVVQYISRENLPIVEIPTIVLYDDGSFKAEYMPCYLDVVAKSENSIVTRYPEIPVKYNINRASWYNLTGKWELKSYEIDFHKNWRIGVQFERAVTAENQSDTIALDHYNSFNLRNDDPPYEIYIIRGDPDSWQGLLYKQKL